jgi:hypothetical protein
VGLSEKAYQARFFVGATNVPDVIDIDRLAPGSIIVDDSFPPCFDLAAAVRRFNTACDVLCVAGGSVRLPEPFKWELAVPPGAPAPLRIRQADALMPPARVITGCILSSVLPLSAGLQPTVGGLATQDCKAYWDGFARLGIEAAPLHCGSWMPTPADLLKFASNTATTGANTARRTRQFE